MGPHGNAAQVNYVKVLVEKVLAALLGVVVVIENVKSVIVLVLRINAVGGIAAAQTVAAVVHYGYGLYDALSVYLFSAFGENSGYGAARGYPYLAFLFEHLIIILSVPAAHIK